MNVLFVTIAYPKQGQGNIYVDLMKEFKKNGHRIFIACSSERRHNLKTFLSLEDDMNVLRIRIDNLTGKVNLLEKGLTTLLIERIYLKAINKFFNGTKFDLIIYSTPPITFTKLIKSIKKRDHAKTYLLLKDIFPQNAVDIGLMRKGSLIHKYFRAKEKNLYKLSNYIGCMSQANVEYVIEHNPFVNEENIEICPNSIDSINIEISDNEIKNIRKKYEIPEDKTVFIYGGNLGKPQGIDFLMQCLIENEKNDKSFMIIAGSGTEYERLKDFFHKEELQNAKLFSHIPKDDYDLLVNTCDVGLIFLDHRFTIPNFPSRMLSYMQASIPILAFTDQSTDIGKVIEEGKFGYWAESGDLKAFRKNVERICSEPQLRKTMGINGRNYLESHYTVKHTYDIIMKHFI